MNMKYRTTLLSAAILLSGLAVLSCTKTEGDSFSTPPVNKAAAVAFTDDGATNGLFAIGEGTYVRFSRGNLQYQASSRTWRFANNQYDFIGSANENISATNAGWIDLFGWGTSGWNSGATCYQPYENNADPALYAPQGNPSVDLAGTQADWGVNNAISNGGNRAGSWRTLTREEWNYLFGNSDGEAYGRTELWGAATVGTAPGIVLLPNRRCGADGVAYRWQLPEGLTFVAGQSAGWTTNTYTLEQWTLLELSGAVFLPAAQYRDNYSAGGGAVASTYIDITDGYYWTTTRVNSTSAYIVRLSANKKITLMDRQYGLSVRLVSDYRN